MATQTYEKTTKARSTGATIYVGPAEDYECDPATPWMTLCETHGACCFHGNLQTARSWAAEPEMWCGDCQDVAEGDPR